MRATKLGVTLALVLPLLVVGGCIHQRPHPPLANQAVAFNLTVEQAQNEMLLLNVIRAKDRLPMYLTAISSLNGNLSAGLTAGLGGSYSHATGDSETVGGSDSTTTASGAPSTTVASSVSSVMSKTITRGLSPSLGATLSRNPNFTLAVLDSEKFTRGFLKPIDQLTFAYFWDQGWPPEILLYLLVQRVEVDGKPLQNYPPDRENFEEFAAWVTDFIARDPQLASGTVEKPIGPPFGADGLELGDLIDAAEAGLSVDESKKVDGWQLRRKAAELCFSVRGSEDCGQPEVAAEELRPGTMSSYVADGAAATKTTLILRSPEAMLYYLGELMRVTDYGPGQARSRDVPHVCIQGEWQPLFVAVRAGDCRNPDPFVVARSPWGDYAIPRSEASSWEQCSEPGAVEYRNLSRGAENERFCAPGRSMQALRLLSQLISLQKSADELPSPALVRVISE